MDRWDAGLGADCWRRPRAVKSQNTRQNRRRLETNVSCGSTLIGAIRGKWEASRQTHCNGESQHVNVAEWRSLVSLDVRAATVPKWEILVAPRLPGTDSREGHHIFFKSQSRTSVIITLTCCLLVGAPRLLSPRVCLL